MPRIRTVKPSIWTDEKVRQLSHEARLLMVGLITQADDDGRFVAVPMTLAGNLYTFDDVPLAKVRKWRDEIATRGLIELYQVDGAEYGHFPKWSKHQKIDRRTASVLPAPPRWDSSSRSSSDSSSGSTPDMEGKGREGIAAAAATARQQQRIELAALTPAVGWDLEPAHWVVVDEAIDRCGVQLVAQVACQRAGKKPPGSARAWITLWANLSPKPRPAERGVCDVHRSQLSSMGVCSGCEAERKAAR